MKTSSLVAVALAAVVLFAAQYASLADSSSPRVIIVGAGMSGISAGKQLWASGVKNLVILEATERVGGRMHNHNFGGINVEIGANWVEGLGGDNLNPIWPIVNSTLKLRNFYSDFDSVVGNVYKANGGGLYEEEYVQKRIDHAYEVQELMRPNGQDDISVLAMQRLFNHQPNGPATPLDMALDYFIYDYEFAEPPRVTSLQNTQPTATNADFGEDNYFVADQRGYESIIHYIGSSYLSTDGNGKLSDRRILLNKVVRKISYNKQGGVVKTEDGSSYSADYVVVSTSLGVLQTDLIKFTPQLPFWKLAAIYRFDMGAYTKSFLKFPTKFWPVGEGKQFFVYASTRRGYYGMWQSFERDYAGVNVLMVTRHRRRVAADRAAERQPDQGGGGQGAARHVPRRRRAGPRGDRHLRAALVVQPLLQGLLLQLAHRRQPLRVRLAKGIDSANILVNRIFKNEEYKVRGKYEFDDLITEVNGKAAKAK